MTRHDSLLNNMISARWRAIAMCGAGKHRSIGSLVAKARYRSTRKTQEGQWQKPTMQTLERNLERNMAKASLLRHPQSSDIVFRHCRSDSAPEMARARTCPCAMNLKAILEATECTKATMTDR